MGLFSRKRVLDLDDIVSVMVLEQTQLYQEKSKWGVSLGAGAGDDRVILSSTNVPAGTEIQFSVTFRDGHKEVIKAISGTEECTRLLQMAYDPSDSEQFSSEDTKDDYVPFEIQKNQLPSGEYIVGEEIPAGTYDFTWVFGHGSIHVFKDATDTKTLGASKYFQWMGNKHDYEYRQCLNVKCDQGNVIVLQGNLVVEISRSKKIQIDL